MPKHKIPPNLTELLLERAGAGQSGAQIAAWLAREHAIRVTGRAVLGLLKKTRDERAPIAQAVLQEKLGKTLAADLAALDGVLSRATEIESEARKAGERDEALRAQDRQLRALELRFKLSGADQSQAPEPMIVVLPAERPIPSAKSAIIETETEAAVEEQSR